jgi:hypothetical protein
MMAGIQDGAGAPVGEDFIDVTPTASAMGFSLPVLVAPAVWRNCVAWKANTGRRARIGLSEADRLEDLLLAAWRCWRTEPAGYHAITVPSLPADGHGTKLQPYVIAMRTGGPAIHLVPLGEPADPELAERARTLT